MQFIILKEISLNQENLFEQVSEMTISLINNDGLLYSYDNLSQYAKYWQEFDIYNDTYINNFYKFIKKENNGKCYFSIINEDSNDLEFNNLYVISSNKLVIARGLIKKIINSSQNNDEKCTNINKVINDLLRNDTSYLTLEFIKNMNLIMNNMKIESKNI